MDSLDFLSETMEVDLKSAFLSYLDQKTMKIVILFLLMLISDGLHVFFVSKPCKYPLS